MAHVQRYVVELNSMSNFYIVGNNLKVITDTMFHGYSENATDKNNTID